MAHKPWKTVFWLSWIPAVFGYGYFVWRLFSWLSHSMDIDGSLFFVHGEILGWLPLYLLPIAGIFSLQVALTWCAFRDEKPMDTAWRIAFYLSWIPASVCYGVTIYCAAAVRLPVTEEWLLYCTVPSSLFLVLQITLGWHVFRGEGSARQKKRDALFRTLFGLSWVVLGVISWYVCPRSVYGSDTIEPWSTYFHAFPLSLFVSLQVWLGYQAFTRPTGAEHVRWKIAFWANFIPGGILYAVMVEGAQTWRFGEEAFFTTLFFSVPTVLFLVLQLAFAMAAFRR